MASPLYVPIGERASLGIGKETTFGTPVTPTLFFPLEDFSPTPKNTAIPRTGARGQLSQVYPATGTYVGKLSLQVEPDPDTLPMLLAYALGTQTTPSLEVVNTTVTTLAVTAATTVDVADATNIVPGESITIGTNSPIVVSSVSGTTVNLASGLTSQVSIGGAVTLTSTTAYTSTAKLGTPLPTFTCQNNRVTDTVAYSGCKVDTFDLTLDPKKGLTAKFTLLNQTESKVGSPATPVYSALYPFLFETAGGSTTFNGSAIGVAGTAAVLGWQIQGANTLDANYFSAANGRFPMSFPEQMRKFTGKATLGFENDVAQQAFWGGSSGPGTVIAATALNFFMVSTDLADATAGIPYSLNLKMSKVFIEAADVAQKPGAILQQAVTFQMSQSSAGADDDLVATWVNTASAVY